MIKQIWEEYRVKQADLEEDKVKQAEFWNFNWNHGRDVNSKIKHPAPMSVTVSSPSPSQARSSYSNSNTYVGLFELITQLEAIIYKSDERWRLIRQNSCSSADCPPHTHLDKNDQYNNEMISKLEDEKDKDDTELKKEDLERDACMNHDCGDSGRGKKLDDDGGDGDDEDDNEVKSGARARGGRGGSVAASGVGRGRFMPFGERKDPPHKGEKEVPEDSPNCLDGLTFVISGILDSLDKEEAEDLIKRENEMVLVFTPFDRGKHILFQVSSSHFWLVHGQGHPPEDAREEACTCRVIQSSLEDKTVLKGGVMMGM